MRRVPINRLRRTASPFVIAAVVVAIDAGTKYWARRSLAHSTEHLWGPARLRLSYNAGLSFSIAHTAPFVAGVLAIMALAGLSVVTLFTRRGWPAVGFGLLIGGGYGNLVDRLSSPRHAVTDFVSVGSFPTFNVADAAITVGVVILFVTALRGKTLVAFK